MSEQSTYYTLKPGYEKALEDYKTGHGDTDVFLFELEKLIQPLDIETIRQKLDLFASEYYDDAVNNEKDYANQNRMEREFFEVKEIQHKSFVDAVLGVVGLTKETE